jgi:hypothetical protein
VLMLCPTDKKNGIHLKIARAEGPARISGWIKWLILGSIAYLFELRMQDSGQPSQSLVKLKGLLCVCVWWDLQPGGLSWTTLCRMWIIRMLKNKKNRTIGKMWASDQRIELISATRKVSDRWIGNLYHYSDHHFQFQETCIDLHQFVQVKCPTQRTVLKS